jgi:predicted site-specific integrase-resolvase
MIVVVKLSEWAKADGLSRQSAGRWSCAGVLAVPALKLSTGMILLEGNEPSSGGVAVYARVSSADQRSGPDRPLARPGDLAAGECLGASKVVPALGSGLNRPRAELPGL